FQAVFFENTFLGAQVDWCDVNNRDDTDRNLGQPTVLCRIVAFGRASSPPPQDVSTSRPAAAAAATLPRKPSVFMMSSSYRCEASREFSEASHNGMRNACDRQWFFELTLMSVFFCVNPAWGPDCQVPTTVEKPSV